MKKIVEFIVVFLGYIFFVSVLFLGVLYVLDREVKPEQWGIYQSLEKVIPKTYEEFGIIFQNGEDKVKCKANGDILYNDVLICNDKRITDTMLKAWKKSFSHNHK